MDKHEFDAMEVKSKEAGFYLVTLFCFEKTGPERPKYFQDWLEFDGTQWKYEKYAGNCYVCFIHKQRTNFP